MMTQHEFAILKSLKPLECDLMSKVLGAYGEQPVCTALMRMIADRCTLAMESVQAGRRKGETAEGWKRAMQSSTSGPSRDFYHEDFRAFLSRFTSADLIVTSPPYVDARTPEAYGVDKPWTVQDDRDLGDAMFAALRPGGTAFVVVGAPVRKWRKGHGTERGLEPIRWLLDLVDRVGFTCRDVLAYHRTGNVGEYRGRFRGDFEPVLWLERPGGEPAFDKNPLDEPAAYGTRGGGGTRKPNGTMRVRQKSGDAVERGVKRRGTVWYYPVGCGHTAPAEMEAAQHSAPFPLKLAEDAVACFSKPGDLVLDPFSGRGTTALACAKLGRRFAGGDLGRAKDGRSWAEVAADVVAKLAA